jgi:hypothetical protein
MSVELQRKMRVIKAFELALGCRIEVIHAPGNSMIDQGTDGSSRGLWIIPSSRISTNITMDLFHPAPTYPLLLEWEMIQVGSPVPPQ